MRHLQVADVTLTFSEQPIVRIAELRRFYCEYERRRQRREHKQRYHPVDVLESRTKFLMMWTTLFCTTFLLTIEKCVTLSWYWMTHLWKSDARVSSLSNKTTIESGEQLLAVTFHRNTWPSPQLTADDHGHQFGQQNRFFASQRFSNQIHSHPFYGDLKCHMSIAQYALDIRRSVSLSWELDVTKASCWV